ncbi:hypothetical protein Vadar_002412 [Vaccinium darrowii]|uniref:Uncharacterized protein n=1 Tax=Vaccinium darrowii TaxID=229202 RepID=A0ACB7Y5T6_9ERIC|nr:hypothetical protein Vadar_002412 [Vaccinium darrowii]
MLASVPRRALLVRRGGEGFGPTGTLHSTEMEKLWFGSNDLPIDVLSRLPLKNLLSLKCVSKQWGHLISERSFMRHRSERKEPISGFFFQERFQWCDDDIRSISYIPVKMEEATKVQCSAFNFLPQSVVLLSVSNGLICCRNCFPSQQPVVYVCNPLNKECVTLPWPSINKQSSLGLAFDPSTDTTDQSTNFKLVAVHQNENETETEMEDSYFLYDIYSSKTRTWARSKETCQCNHNLFKNKGIFIGGALYWLTDGDQILMFDVQNELSWLISVPFPLGAFDIMPEVCIGESEGKLHYVLICERGVHLWVLEDYLDLKWACKYSITHDEMERENSEFLYNVQEKMASRINTIPWMDPLAFKDGLLFLRVAAKIYLYNFGTNKLEELCTLSMLGPNSTISPIVLPYSMTASCTFVLIFRRIKPIVTCCTGLIEESLFGKGFTSLVVKYWNRRQYSVNKCRCWEVNPRLDLNSKFREPSTTIGQLTTCLALLAYLRLVFKYAGKACMMKILLSNGLQELMELHQERSLVSLRRWTQISCI